jgi:hypothetical protein
MEAAVETGGFTPRTPSGQKGNRVTAGPEPAVSCCTPPREITGSSPVMTGGGPGDDGRWAR